MGADEYNAGELAEGRIRPGHLTALAKHYQRDHGLDVDGAIGPTTRAHLEGRSPSSSTRPLPLQRAFPLRMLPDGRKPVVTSRFKSKNSSRPNHNGVDLFYKYDAAKDPPMKDGDGGRAGGWFIPDEWPAVSGAAGRVVIAGWSSTGFRAWIDVGEGWSIGYFHLSRLDVRAGDIVARGTPVGIVGDNPIDRDARHLHFELYQGDLDDYRTGRGQRDPEMFLDGASIFAG